MTNVIIKGNINVIDNFTFEGCSNLSAIAIPGSVTNIGVSAFYNCFRLASVTIPGNVISIGASAFYSCGVTNLTIGNGVASIGASAVAACPRLANVVIPQSVISIGAAPFLACSGLTAITVDASNPSYSSVDGVLFNKNQTVLIQWPEPSSFDSKRITSAGLLLDTGGKACQRTGMSRPKFHSVLL